MRVRAFDPSNIINAGKDQPSPYNTRVNAKDIESLLATNRRPAGLDLRGATLSPEAIHRIGCITSLEWVDLSESTVTDDELESLTGLYRLEDIYLTNTKITDAGLRHIAKLRNLVWVGLKGTKVTKEGREYLQQQLPHADI